MKLICLLTQNWPGRLLMAHRDGKCQHISEINRFEMQIYAPLMLPGMYSQPLLALSLDKKLYWTLGLDMLQALQQSYCFKFQASCDLFSISAKLNL